MTSNLYIECVLLEYRSVDSRIARCESTFQNVSVNDEAHIEDIDTLLQ